MQTRFFESIGQPVSLLGYGCMRFPKIPGTEKVDEPAAQKLVDRAIEGGINYFDTAYPYHAGTSEIFIGKALKKYPRDSFFLASKLPLWELKTEADLDRIFNEQLARCQVEYFDFYLLHNLCVEHTEYERKVRAYEYLLKQKEAGRIRHLGFSFHDTPALLEKHLQNYDVDFVQLQINYLDWEMQHADQQYEIAARHNLPVIVMEPVRGGALASLCPEALATLSKANPDASPVSWALRFVAGLPGVLTVLSGMSDMAQVEDNLKTLGQFSPLTDGESTVLQQALSEYRASGTVPCTGCRYCMDCPSGVDIPRIFSAYNQYCRLHKKRPFYFQTAYTIIGEEHQAHNCVACRLCEKRCPQHIEISRWMADIGREAQDIMQQE